MLHNILNLFINGLIWTAIDIEMRKTTQNYTKIILKLHYSNLWKRSWAAQVPLARATCVLCDKNIIRNQLGKLWQQYLQNCSKTTRTLQINIEITNWWLIFRINIWRLSGNTLNCWLYETGGDKLRLALPSLLAYILNLACPNSNQTQTLRPFLNSNLSHLEFCCTYTFQRYSFLGISVNKDWISFPKIIKRKKYQFKN